MRLVIAAAGLFLAYAVTRAVRVPLTYDEAASYIRYIDTTVPSVFDTNRLSIFNFEVATNHFLNTLFSKVCWLMAGGGALCLRLPNLLAYGLYLVCSWLLLRRCAHRFIALAGFVAVNANPYLLDFFALSRGYGLALGLMMASLVFVLDVVDETVRTEERPRHLSRALALACGAAMANLAMLNLYVALFSVLLAAAVYTARSQTPPPMSSTRRQAYVWPVAAGGLFAALVFSQDFALTPRLYRPVVVSLAGIDGPTIDRVRVVSIDLRGRERRVARDPDAAIWRVAGGAVRSLRIELPVEDAAGLARIDTVVGGHVFPADPTQVGLWTSHDDGGRRVLVADPPLAVQRSRMPAFHAAINWSGDTVYAASIAAHAGRALAILALVAVLLHALGRLADDARVIDPRTWQALATGALWLGAFAGPPVYVLRRHAELYFGGASGLVTDTFSSIVERSFYGRTYLSSQVGLVVGGAGLMLGIFALVVYLASRRGAIARTIPALVLLAIATIAAGGEVVQHVAFGTPYLSERTALFYLPLFVLFATFTCDGLAVVGVRARFTAVALCAIGLLLSTGHLLATMNMTSTLDWRADASTRRMMQDLRQAAVENPTRSNVVVAVQPRYAPVAVYYARMTREPIVGVVQPSDGGDFWYGSEADLTGGLRVIKRYPLTATVLARPDAAQ